MTATLTELPPTQVNEEYANLIRKLTNVKYQALKQSIKEHDQLIPIIVNQDGIVIDGHHRFKACKELLIDAKIEVRDFSNKADEQLFIHECNEKRRHLSLIENILTKLEDKPKLEKLAQKNQKAGVKQEFGQGMGPSGVNRLVGKEVGTSHETVRKVEVIREHAPELLDKVKNHKLSIDKAYRTVQKEQLLIEREKKVASCSGENNFSPNMQLINSDFKQTKLNEGSIDLIFTDPPYEEKWLPNYSDLAILADKTLVQNGSLVTYCNQTQIPQIIQDIENMGLTYWHTIVIILENTFARNFPRRIVYKYKPLLWFVKGKRAKGTDFLSDIIYSKRPDKNLHPWQQSNVEAEHVISRLTTEGQTVLDPLMGSGTTGIAAMQLLRKFIGIEIDDTSFKIAQTIFSKLNERKKELAKNICKGAPS